MMTGELVLPLVIVGITEASTTRRPEIPWTRSRSSTTAMSSLPILAVPTGWKMVVAMSPAARASSSSLAICGPGLNSSGEYFAMAGWATMRRVRRIASATTRRSAGAER